ncbi:hypothetical protein GDO78_017695 [Eleutherodactylus coqui]|uniref:Uncharacterized protein n=1 Tax=Eleutherodactylus coqui TaxID=57060 RepID=A0A8J6B9U6_ELECQ|nr:hypothetical protein GDO78_017695 [Eleutherodactylus coqui]
MVEAPDCRRPVHPRLFYWKPCCCDGCSIWWKLRTVGGRFTPDSSTGSHAVVMDAVYGRSSGLPAADSPRTLLLEAMLL